MLLCTVWVSLIILDAGNNKTCLQSWEIVSKMSGKNQKTQNASDYIATDDSCPVAVSSFKMPELAFQRQSPTFVSPKLLATFQDSSLAINAPRDGGEALLLSSW